jgi:hypothetical protein
MIFIPTLLSLLLTDGIGFNKRRLFDLTRGWMKHITFTIRITNKYNGIHTGSLSSQIQEAECDSIQ